MPSGLSKSSTQVKYIYIIYDAKNACKIGISSNPESRLKDLQAGNSVELKLYKTIQVQYNKANFFESRIHKILHKHKIHREWFFIDPELAFHTLYRVVHGVEKAKERAARIFARQLSQSKVTCP